MRRNDPATKAASGNIATRVVSLAIAHRDIYTCASLWGALGGIEEDNFWLQKRDVVGSFERSIQGVSYICWPVHGNRYTAGC
jgi:hypothetical protein